MTGYEKSPDYGGGGPVTWRDFILPVAIAVAGAAFWWLFG